MLSGEEVSFVRQDQAGVTFILQFFKERSEKYLMSSVRYYCERGELDATWLCSECWSKSDPARRTPEQMRRHLGLYDEGARMRSVGQGWRS